jgi:hypothetical protein
MEIVGELLRRDGRRSQRLVEVGELRTRGRREHDR